MTGLRRASLPKSSASSTAATDRTRKASRLTVPYGATVDGSAKMPPPMMLPMTRAVAAVRPKARRRGAGEGSGRVVSVGLGEVMAVPL